MDRRATATATLTTLWVEAQVYLGKAEKAMSEGNVSLSAYNLGLCTGEIFKIVAALGERTTPAKPA